MDDKVRYKRIPDVPQTAVEIYRMLPEGTRCEVIFNVLVMSEPRTFQHQLVLSEVQVPLYFFLREKDDAEIIPGPFDVYLEEQLSAVQPDLSIFVNDNLRSIREDGAYGAPDIIVEVLSENKSYETQRKKALYEKAGVKEYFMVDPSTKITALLTLNASGIYEQTYEAAGTLRSSVIGCDISF